MGCATCGFEGFSLGAANVIGNKSRFVRLGSSNRIASKAEENTLHCTAVINGPDGYDAAKASLLRTSGYTYVGIWNANVAPRIYSENNCYCIWQLRDLCRCPEDRGKA